MKCPKCGYLGFESVDRCRNCGYEFSLSVPVSTIELPLNADSADVTRGGEPTRVVIYEAPEGNLAELPLFGEPIPDDVPLITKASPPRPPLAVRRATPEVPRLRSVAPRTATLDLAFEAAASHASSRLDGDGIAEPALEDAGMAARLVALVLDLVILAAIDVAVVYFTMQICGLGLADLAVLPRAPLIAFCVLQNGGYLVAFTAGGQTLGKLMMGIRVVSVDGHSSVYAGSALVRELTRVILTLPAGLGLLPAFFSRDHRGLHDRFAGTRVVRA